jgi:soluble lytic murein transglycosylase-like protein
MNKTPTQKGLHLFALCVAITLCAGMAHSQTPRASQTRIKTAPELEQIDSQSDPGSVRLCMSDGVRISVEEAWESEQGIWYKLSGISQLLPRDRVKSIERGPAPDLQQKIQTQAAKVSEVNTPQTDPSEQPAWIYLVGGARVEADSATESLAGVWYKRGSLSIFIERSRIDRIEREDPETLAASDSPSKKERGWSTGRPHIDTLIKQNGAKYGVDPYLIFCVMEQESQFNSRAQSPKGARGLMQLMPGTGARFGVRRPFDPGQNIAGGTRYLKQLLGQFNGRVDLVLASYNAGEGAVIRFGHRVPPYRETREYVKRISYRYRRSKTPAKMPAPPVTANLATAGGD